MAGEFWLNERQWQWLHPVLLRESRRVPQVDDRRVTLGIVQAMKRGGHWVDVPAVHGLRKRLCNRLALR